MGTSPVSFAGTPCAAGSPPTGQQRPAAAPSTPPPPRASTSAPRQTTPFWGFSVGEEGDGGPSSPFTFGPVSAGPEAAPAEDMAGLPTLPLDEDDPWMHAWQALLNADGDLPPLEEHDAPDPGTGTGTGTDAAAVSSPEGPATKRRRLAAPHGSSEATAASENLLPGSLSLSQAFADWLGPDSSLTEWLKQTKGDLKAHDDVLRFCKQMKCTLHQKVALQSELRTQRADLDLAQARRAMQRHAPAGKALTSEKTPPNKEMLTCMLLMADWKLTPRAVPAAGPAAGTAQGSAGAGQAHTMANFIAHLRAMNPAGCDGEHYLEPCVWSAMRLTAPPKTVDPVLDLITSDLPNWGDMRRAATNFDDWLQRTQATGLGSWLKSIHLRAMDEHPDVKDFFEDNKLQQIKGWGQSGHQSGERRLTPVLSFLRAKLSAEAAGGALVKQGQAGVADWNFIRATVKRPPRTLIEQFFATWACLARWSAWQRDEACPAPWSLQAHVEAGRGMPTEAQQLAFARHLRQTAGLGDAPHHLEATMPDALGLLRGGGPEDPFIKELKAYMRKAGYAKSTEGEADRIIRCLVTFDQIDGSTLQAKVSSYQKDQHEASFMEAVKAQGKGASTVRSVMSWAKAALAACPPPVDEAALSNESFLQDFEQKMNGDGHRRTPGYLPVLRALAGVADIDGATIEEKLGNYVERRDRTTLGRAVKDEGGQQSNIAAALGWARQFIDERQAQAGPTAAAGPSGSQ